MDDLQGFRSASGIVLHRRVAGEGDLLLTLFLKGLGLTFVSARGAASGKVRFGGGTEPLIWGNFKLYRGRSGGYHLKSVDIVDDLLKLRGRSAAMFTVIRWAKLLMRHLPQGHSADDLLANLYWNMKLLDGQDFPVAVAEWRFTWRWLKSQGLAPDLLRCSRCGTALNSAFWTDEGLHCRNCARSDQETFSAKDLSLLRSIGGMASTELLEFLRKQEFSPSDLRLFMRATHCLETLLIEI